MKTRLEDLIKKAKVAQPPELIARSNWIPYLPILRILMEERAHSLMAAVEWLVVQGEIEKSRQAIAYRALRQILARREAKQNRQQLRLQRQLHTTPDGEPLPRAAKPEKAATTEAPTPTPIADAA